MVRNLMMIFGLTLAVAAFGCDSDSTNAAGSGGSGGSGGGGGEGGAAGAGGAGEGGAGGAPSADACVNDSDLGLVCAADFADKVSACATPAAGEAAATSTCLQDDPGLSAECADCSGAQVQCIRDNCVFGGGSVCLPPATPDDPDCMQCQIDSGCLDDYDTCAGELICE